MVPGNAGSETVPAADSGWVGLSRHYCQLRADDGHLQQHNRYSSAPFLRSKLPARGLGLEAVWRALQAQAHSRCRPESCRSKLSCGALALALRSTSSAASGGGGGGGYARKRIAGLTPGQSITVAVGAGGNAGATGVAPTSGQGSSFGSYVSATGGTVNPLATLSLPRATWGWSWIRAGRRPEFVRLSGAIRLGEHGRNGGRRGNGKCGYTVQLATQAWALEEALRALALEQVETHPIPVRMELGAW